MSEAYTGRFIEDRAELWNNFDTELPIDGRNTVEDPVEHPAHYCKGGVECIDAIRASMSREAFAGYCKGNVQKYTWRYEEKGGVESLKKARMYMDWLIEVEEKKA
jgi:hypothetical protein